MAIVYTTAYEIAFAVDLNSQAGRTSRYWIDSAALDPIVPVPAGQTHVRLRYVASSTTPLRLNSTYIGHAFDPPADEWDAADLTQVTFEGLGSVTIPAGESLVSDPIAFVYDGVSPLIITYDTLLSPASGERFTNFNIPGGSGMQPWRTSSGGGQRASELTLDDLVAGETIGFLNSSTRCVDRFEWGVDTEATNSIEVSKLNGYAVVKPATPIEASKLSGYAVVREVVPITAAKVTGYAVVKEMSGSFWRDVYAYYPPVVN